MNCERCTIIAVTWELQLGLNLPKEATPSRKACRFALFALFAPSLTSLFLVDSNPPAREGYRLLVNLGFPSLSLSPSSLL